VHELQALRERGLPGAWGSARSCFGNPAAEHRGQFPWELICNEGLGDLTYQAWRRPLRGGFFLYRTRAVIEGATPAEVRTFHMDDNYR
jgi:hypothetical protein